LHEKVAINLPKNFQKFKENFSKAANGGLSNLRGSNDSMKKSYENINNANDST
jgi:hypothetical protein